MPLYDVVCDCGFRKEVVLKLNGEEPVCDVCGLQMRRAVSAPAFVLKGGGWASDGYSSAASKSGCKKGGTKNA